MTYTSPPFRFDIVGSFKRPDNIKNARIQLQENKLSKEALTQLEDEEIKKLVSKEVEIGLHAVTDGEYRRSGWLHDFHFGFKGLKEVKMDQPLKLFPRVPILNYLSFEVVGNIEYNENHHFFDSFVRLKNFVPPNVIPKICIPSPSMLFNMRRGSLNVGVDIVQSYYKGDKERFFSDLGTAYNKTIRKLYDLGLRYLQIDDCAFGTAVTWYSNSTTDEERAGCIQFANDIATVDNLALKDLPSDLTVVMHICRGNNKSDYFGTGAYDYIAQQIASVVVNGYFLEYDDERSGDFATILPHILKNGRSNVKVVLGLLTSKRAELEDENAIIERIEEAAKYYPRELLCLSTQCGFASSINGENLVTFEQQWAKLEHVIKIARKVWSDA